MDGGDKIIQEGRKIESVAMVGDRMPSQVLLLLLSVSSFVCP